jgi:CO/xanthine dehydrogenase Mo-binding subunit
MSTAHVPAARTAGAPQAPAPELPPDRAVLPPVIGTAVQRVDAVEKVTGRAAYAADVRLPRMLHGAVVRSPHAHARIVSVDTSLAERLPGVHAVVTGADTARIKWGAFRPDLYPLAL